MQSSKLPSTGRSPEATALLYASCGTESDSDSVVRSAPVESARVAPLASWLECCAVRDGDEAFDQSWSGVVCGTRSTGVLAATKNGTEEKENLVFYECCEYEHQLRALAQDKESASKTNSRGGCFSDLAPRGCTDFGAAAKVLERTRERFSQRFNLAKSKPELEWANIFTAQRMLKANTYDHQKAVEMFLHALDMRAKDRELFQTLKCEAQSDMRIIGHDRQERPLVYMCAKSQMKPLKYMRDQFVVTFEAACKMSREEGTDGTVMFVVDMHGLQPHLNCDFIAVKDLAEVLGTVFAERIHKIVVVDFSRAAQAAWWALKPLLREATRQKFAFIGVTEAKQLLKADLDDASFQRICATFDINRDPNSTVEEVILHARRTTICDAPLGPPLK